MCKNLPRNFTENIEKLLTLPPYETAPVISEMVSELKEGLHVFQ
jgi:hypothetical protein